MNPERKVEIILWDWLIKQPNVNQVYFNDKNNEVNAPVFNVIGDSSEKPDLVIECILFNKKEFIALEVKDGSKGTNVTSACKIFDKYIVNYIEKKTKYFINEKEIKIDRFGVATQYSIIGKLFKNHDDVIENEAITDKVGKNFLNKVVPKIEFTRTRQFLRQVISSYSQYRKKNNIKEAPGLIILISNIIFNFSLEELKIQQGMKGQPIIQGIHYNPNKVIRGIKKGGWQQCLIKL